jgi:hypothetical protein
VDSDTIGSHGGCFVYSSSRPFKKVNDGGFFPHIRGGLDLSWVTHVFPGFLFLSGNALYSKVPHEFPIGEGGTLGESPEPSDCGVLHNAWHKRDKTNRPVSA